MIPTTGYAAVRVLPNSGPLNRVDADAFFDVRSNQKEVFTTVVEPLVDLCFTGYSATVIAIGESRSGKTYTMMGTVDDEGVIPRTLRLLVDRAGKKSASASRFSTEQTWSITMSMVNVLCEQAVDLLSNGVHVGAKGFPLQGAQRRPIETWKDAADALSVGNATRAEHAKNFASHMGWCHTVVTIDVVERVVLRLHDGTTAVARGATASIKFVDLAGTEQSSKSSGGLSLNTLSARSLRHALELMLISGPTNGAPSSMLADLLSAALRGTEIVRMFACIRGGNEAHTQQTLRYVAKVRLMQIAPQARVDDAAKTLIQLCEEIDSLQKLIDGARQSGKDRAAIENLNRLLLDAEKAIRSHFPESENDDTMRQREGELTQLWRRHAEQTDEQRQLVEALTPDRGRAVMRHVRAAPIGLEQAERNLEEATEALSQREVEIAAHISSLAMNIIETEQRIQEKQSEINAMQVQRQEHLRELEKRRQGRVVAGAVSDALFDRIEELEASVTLWKARYTKLRRSGKIDCPKCTFENFISTHSCAMCGSMLDL